MISLAQPNLEMPCGHQPGRPGPGYLPGGSCTQYHDGQCPGLSHARSLPGAACQKRPGTHRGPVLPGGPTLRPRPGGIQISTTGLWPPTSAVWCGRLRGGESMSYEELLWGVLVVAILLLILLWVAMENNIMLCRTYDKLKKEHQEMERFLQEKLRMDGEYFDAYAYHG